MDFERHADGGFSLVRLGEAELNALRAIASDADPAGVDAAEFRLFPEPVFDGEDAEFLDDWAELVQPQLRQAFADALSLVSRDVASANGGSRHGADQDAVAGEEAGGPPWRVDVRADHRDAWCSALNQARLVMHERYQFPESDSPAELVAVLTGGHAREFGRSRFYAGLLEWIVGTYQL